MLITQNADDLIPVFQAGGVFAYPTEAVFGLGCDPDNQDAVMRLLAIKQRPVSKGLILIASDFAQVAHYLQPLTPAQRKLTAPSQTTYVYPALTSAPAWLTGDFASLAVRITSHPAARALCNTLQSALVSTSANVSGQVPARSVLEVKQQFDHKIDAILDAEPGKLDNPTVIRDSISGKIIRP